MDELEKLRKQIDETDEKLLGAFVKRLEIAEGVARYKIDRNKPVFDAAREEEVLKKREQMAGDPALAKDVRRLFILLMSISRARQQALINRQSEKSRRQAHSVAGAIAFCGIPGAYAHQALTDVFGMDANAMALGSFEEVFSAVADGRAACGVLPIENSHAGSVLRVYDLLDEYPLYITGEYLLKIEHALLAKRGTALSDIRKVYSHEQALSQCAEYLAAHKGWELVPYYNTAAAAKFVAQSEDKSAAAIASRYAGELYGLNVLEDGINTSSENATRFILLSKEMQEKPVAKKASIRFSLEHKAGSLQRALAHFAEYGLNMVKIESRPMPGRSFEYIFYVDFEGKDVSEAVRGALEDAGGVLREPRILGVY
ncbi:MAG: prephenate dehydratase [Christensenellaceae bacterium]|jgi:chorismate mutase/prephenate dehydratase